MRRPFIATSIILSIAVSCTGNKEPAAKPVSPGSPLPPPRLAAGQTGHEIRATFQYGSFEVTIGDSVYDKSAEKLYIGVRFRNLSDQWRSTDSRAIVRVAGQDRAAFLDGGVNLPPSLASDQTLTVTGLKNDPTADGALIWGRSGREATIPLAGGGQPLWRPVELSLDGWAHIGKYAIHTTRAQVLAGSVGKNEQAPPGQRVLRIHYEEWANRLDPVNGFNGVEHLRLKRPDGTFVNAEIASAGRAPMSWTTSADNWIEFPIADSVAGRYELQLSSISTGAFGAVRRHLIERVPIPFEIGNVERETSSEPDPPRPTLLAASAPTSIDVPLDAGTINAGGFFYRPTRLRWDPQTHKATIDGTATFIETDNSSRVGDEHQSPFTLNVLLGTRRTFYSGAPIGDNKVTRTPKALTFSFSSVRSIDPNDAAILMGSRYSGVSTLPLGGDSPLVVYPTPATVSPVAAPRVTAGIWTARIRSFRYGRVRSAPAPRPGFLELEIFVDVTAARNARPDKSEMTFIPQSQLFITNPDGYLTQAAGDSGLHEFAPGETKRISVTFHVPDSFRPGRKGFALRSADEKDLISNYFESTFASALGAEATEEPVF